MFEWFKKRFEQKECSPPYNLPMIDVAVEPASRFLENTKKIESLFESIKQSHQIGLEKWDRRFLGLAQYISQWSKDKSTKVGAVITDCNNRIVSVGYNGLPQGVEDKDEILDNRELKYSMVVHGEMNAILFAKSSLVDCILYTTPFMPCSKCAAMVIQTGIKRVVTYYNDNPRWIESFKITEQLFKESGVELVFYKED